MQWSFRSKTTGAIEILANVTNETQMMLILGLSSVYRKFILYYSKLGSPLNMKLKKWGPTRFELGECKKRAADTLK